MSDINDKKNSTPVLIVVICASITMVAQTIASTAAVLGYDEVIKADAEARAAKILQVKSKECAPQIDQSALNQINQNTLSIEVLTENSHAPAK